MKEETKKVITLNDFDHLFYIKDICHVCKLEDYHLVIRNKTFIALGCFRCRTLFRWGGCNGQV